MAEQNALGVNSEPEFATLIKSDPSRPAGLIGTVVGGGFFIIAVFVYSTSTIVMFLFALILVGLAFFFFMAAEKALDVFVDIGDAIFGRHQLRPYIDHEKGKIEGPFYLDANDIQKYHVYLQKSERNEGDQTNSKYFEKLRKKYPERVPSELNACYHAAIDRYDRTNKCLEYVANTMPLFGLIGTLFEMLQIFGGLDDNISMSNLAPQIKLAFSCTMWGAVLSAFFKVVQSRVVGKLDDLESDMERLKEQIQISATVKSTEKTSDGSSVTNILSGKGVRDIA